MSNCFFLHLQSSSWVIIITKKRIDIIRCFALRSWAESILNRLLQAFTAQLCYETAMFHPIEQMNYVNDWCTRTVQEIFKLVQTSFVQRNSSKNVQTIDRSWQLEKSKTVISMNNQWKDIWNTRFSRSINTLFACRILVSGHFVLCHFNRCNFNRSHFQPRAISTACNFNRVQFQPRAISTAANSTASII